MIRLKQTNYIFLNSFFNELKSRREKMAQAKKILNCSKCNTIIIHFTIFKLCLEDNASNIIKERQYNTCMTIVS